MKSILCKKISLLFLFTNIFTIGAFAADYSFKCKYPGINSTAMGTYDYNYPEQLYYNSPNGTVTDILSIIPLIDNSPSLTLNRNTVSIDTMNLYNNSTYDFDEEGNLYFMTSVDYSTFDYQNPYSEYKTCNKVTFVHKFNPNNLSVTSIELGSETIPSAICVSPNGKWIFVNLITDFDSTFKTGNFNVYSIDSSFTAAPINLYKTNSPEPYNNNSITGMCFDNNTKTFYFSIHGNIENSNGLHFSNPDAKGNYSTTTKSTISSVSNLPYKLYSNDDGLWTIVKGNSNYSSQLIHITDKNGKFLDVQNSSLKKYQIVGNYKLNPTILVHKNFILFATENSKLYKYENGKLKSITNLIPKKAEYSIKDLLSIQSKLENDLPVSSKQITYRKMMILELVLLIVFFLIICILLIWILHIIKITNQVKKNKQFIFNIQETERGKISRDIHDSIIQDIRAIRIESELIKTDGSGESDIHKNKVVNLATDCVVKLRNICYNLTPAELATHAEGDSSKIELVSIIQSLVLQFIERTHVPCQLKIDENFEYPVFEKEISQNLFRIIQEALNNVEKHSYATNCQILIKNKTEDGKKYMLIYISDDGVGCDPKILLKKKGRYHFGIRNMMERASLIGASIDFQSEPGNGLEVRIKI